MPIELVVAIVVIVVMMCVWIWLNLKWIRGASHEAGKGQTPPAAKPVAKQTDETLKPQTQQAEEQGEAHSGHHDGAVLEQTSQESLPSHSPSSAESVESEPVTLLEETRTELDPAEDDLEQNPPVEVIAPESSRGPKVFERQTHPFRLYGGVSSAFTEERWLRCFYRLTEDAGVLGWIAFHEDMVGASDREYDQKFVDALKTYRQSLEALQKEVGISHIHETSIVGEEGKMWFLSAVDDVWLALFVERSLDVAQLSNRLLNTGPSSPVDEQQSVLS
jgi:hypothetical protein